MSRYKLTEDQKDQLSNINLDGKFIYAEDADYYINYSDILTYIGFAAFFNEVESSGLEEIILKEDILNFIPNSDSDGGGLATALIPESSKPLYIDSYQGRIYVLPGRWYGMNTAYSLGYFNTNYNHHTSSYQYPPVLSYWEAVGSRPDKDRKLKKIIINFTRAIREIDKMHLYVSKITKPTNTLDFKEKVLLHENTPESGVKIINNAAGSIEYEFDEEVTTEDVIFISFNSSSSVSTIKYLYGAEIKYIYE